MKQIKRGTLITREKYLKRPNLLFYPYHSQFVNIHALRVVRETFDIEDLLRRWARHGGSLLDGETGFCLSKLRELAAPDFVNRTKLEEAGELLTLQTMVDVLRAAARRVVDRTVDDTYQGIANRYAGLLAMGKYTQGNDFADAIRATSERIIWGGVPAEEVPMGQPARLCQAQGDVIKIKGGYWFRPNTGAPEWFVTCPVVEEL